MEGPAGITYGTAPAAASATAEVVDDHTAALASHSTQIAANSSAVAAIAGVPSGAIVAFRTAAEVTAAGAGWSRETALDGRILLGAGTAGGQTFTEAQNYGTNWTVTFTSANNSPASGSVNSGAGSTAVPTHTHTTDVLLVPPGRAYVYGRHA